MKGIASFTGNVQKFREYLAIQRMCLKIKEHKVLAR